MASNPMDWFRCGLSGLLSLEDYFPAYGCSSMLSKIVRDTFYCRIEVEVNDQIRDSYIEFKLILRLCAKRY